MTSYEAGGVLANSKTYDGHRRNASADSGHFDMSTIIDGSENGDSEAAMTDLSQENESTDPSPVRNKLSKSQRARNGSAHSNSVDSGVSGSISQDSMELDYERESTAESYASRCSVVTVLEKVDEGEMDEDEPLQAATGEDCPDCPESVCSQAIRGVYPLLVEVFSNQESADKLASDLYSKFLIENTIQGEVRMQGITDEEKARRILNAVMSKLRTSPTHEPFEHFMSVLKCYHSCCDIIVQMRATYQQLQKSSEASGMCYSYAYHNAREELVCGNSTRDAAPLEHQMQGGLHSSIKEHQPVSLSGAFESLEGHHQERKSTIFSMLRQRSISSGGESDVSITSEVEMQDRLKKWEKEGKTLMRGLRKCMDKKQKNASTMEEIAHRLESMVEDLQTQVEEYTKKLKRCTEEKQVLEGELTIARRRILQLNREVITMKKHPRACAGACEHKSKCEELKKQIERLEEEKVDYTANIKNLNQQIDMLLSDDHYVFND